MSYNYRITSKYCYHNGEIVDMFFINGIPFTFDEIPEHLIDLHAEELDCYYYLLFCLLNPL
jgi:hypothetical protein